MNDQVIIEKVEGGGSREAQVAKVQIRVGGGNADASGVGEGESEEFLAGGEAEGAISRGVDLEIPAGNRADEI